MFQMLSVAIRGDILCVCSHNRLELRHMGLGMYVLCLCERNLTWHDYPSLMEGESRGILFYYYSDDIIQESSCPTQSNKPNYNIDTWQTVSRESPGFIASSICIFQGMFACFYFSRVRERIEVPSSILYDPSSIKQQAAQYPGDRVPFAAVRTKAG